MKLEALKSILAEHGIAPVTIQSIIDKSSVLLAQHSDVTENAGEVLESLLTAHEGFETLPFLMPETMVSVDDAEDHSARIGDYDDLGELGQGGMGSVRLVRDRKMNRRLAMKIIHPNLLNHRTAASRFLEEAQICAQLQHPNIVPVHDLGTLPDGRLYFTMKEIRGRSLANVIQRVHAAVKDGRFYPTSDGWTFRRLIDVFHQVCQAVGYAHSKGVLHRDLKPENIMVGEFGEVLVVDWGIAKVVGAVDRAAEAGEFDFVTSSRLVSQATKMGQVAGTPAYMAPEQARGEINKLNVQTDVYALGAILYEILSGQAPYKGPSLVDVIEQVISGPPPSVSTPSQLQGEQALLSFDEMSDELDLQVPKALINACEVAMSRLQSGRYKSADELADIIRIWLEGAKKRDEALAIVRETEQLAEQSSLLKEESEALLKKASEGLKQLPAWVGEDLKGPYWATEYQGLSKQRESQRIDLDIEHRLQSALSHKADLEEGHEALVLRYLKAHQEAEDARAHALMDQNEIRLRHHALSLQGANPLRHRVLHYLKGIGAVSLKCNVEGVDVFLEEFVPHHRRLVPKRIAYLGNQDLETHPLEMGSYRLVLKKAGHHDVIYPVHIGRGEHWDGRDEHGIQRAVAIPKLGELLPSECFVPGGWFWCGGDSLALRSYSRRRVWLDDFVISRFQITHGDFLQFLNSLLADGRQDEALKWVPREIPGFAGELGAMLYGRDENNRFVLAVDADGDKWEEDWPVFFIDYNSAEAYCRWKSKQSGLLYRLPSELEWEKSARGVDGRFFVWGDGFDPSHCNMTESHEGQRLPAVVDSCPIDESVYGVRGCAGNVMDWTNSPFRIDWNETTHHTNRVTRGGSWSGSSGVCRVSYRRSNIPSRVNDGTGFRLLRTPFPDQAN